MTNSMGCFHCKGLMHQIKTGVYYCPTCRRTTDFRPASEIDADAKAARPDQTNAAAPAAAAARRSE